MTPLGKAESSKIDKDLMLLHGTARYVDAQVCSIKFINKLFHNDQDVFSP